MARARGAVRRGIALVVLVAAVALAAQGVYLQVTLPPNPGWDALGPIFAFGGAVTLAIAAAFTWWFSRRDPDLWTYRVVAALGGAWLGAAAALAVDSARQPESWLLILGVAPFFAWSQPLAYVGMLLGAALAVFAVQVERGSA